MDDAQQVIARRFVNVFQGNGSAYGTESGGCVHTPVTWEIIEGHLFGDSRETGTPLSRQTRDLQHVDMGLDYGNAASGRLSVRAWDGRTDAGLDRLE